MIAGCSHIDITVESFHMSQSSDDWWWLVALSQKWNTKRDLIIMLFRISAKFCMKSFSLTSAATATMQYECQWVPPDTEESSLIAHLFKRTGFSHHPKNTKSIEVHYIENILSTVLNLGVNKWQTVPTNYIWRKILVVSLHTGVGCQSLEETSVNKVFFKCSLTSISSFLTDCGIIQKYFLCLYTNEYRLVSDWVAVVPSPPTRERAEDNLGCKMFSDPSPVGGVGSSAIGSDTGQGLFATCLYVRVLRTRLCGWYLSKNKIKSISKALLA